MRWLISLLLVTSWAHADEVDNWLGRMQRAGETQNFQGTLIIRQHDQLHAMRVVHGQGERGEGSWDTLESMNGEHRRVIRRDTLVVTLFPDKNLATRVHDSIGRDVKSLPLHPQLPRDLASLKQIYQVQLAGEDRVAGWPAQIIELLPKDQYRYGFRLWLARDNGLLLRCDLLGERGDVIEQVMYSQLTTMKPVPPPGVPDLTNWRVIDIDAGRQALPDAANIHWRVDRLPAGFRLIHAAAMPSVAAAETDDSHTQAQPTQVQHLIFSDGMTSVSVFVEERVPDNKLLVGVSRMGAVNAFGQSLNGHHVTVIGEVPMLTVRQIAQSLVHAEREPVSHD
ncbi:MAG TPA: MucB/RseB C-terminal domain-containing protein [Gammaproteobacteria bacterium]|nr:MucB/RseB C-terminal domain-containing protein [Gammaproteobacteria bacterium]